MQAGMVRIARELMNRGWKVYGFREDESDSMTDYWSPAYWKGIAEKKWLCVGSSSTFRVKRRNNQKI